MSRWGERVTKTCPQCGGEFKVYPNAKAQKQTYCSIECRKSARVTLAKASCVWCGEEFQPKYKDRTKYCSPECKASYKSVVKVSMRGHKPVSSPVSFDVCPVCHKWFRKTNGNHIMCSVECRNSSGRDRALRNNAIKKMQRVYMCKICGKLMVKEYGDKSRSTCSDQCKGELEREVRHNTKQARRCREKKAFVSAVRRSVIYDRDNWTCQICGKKVKKHAAVPHPLAPTLDHIIPLAVGGTHEPRNVQCAHFICNSRKSHTGSGDQLRLIG